MSTIIFERDTETAKKVLNKFQYLIWITKTQPILMMLSHNFGGDSRLMCFKPSPNVLKVVSKTDDAAELRELIYMPLSNNVLKGMFNDKALKGLNKLFNKHARADLSSFNDYLLKIGFNVSIE
jgi:hypothetical protein